MRHTLASALGTLVLSAALSSPALAEGRLITLSGTGEVRLAPDMAVITSGVATQAATAGAALDENSAAMAKVIAALKAEGIADRDIQTSGFSVSPNYVYSDQRDANGYNLPPQINGYQVSNGVTATVRDLSRLGAILDTSVTVGANTVSGITFGVSDPTAALDEARRKAFADARRKAELYAELAGLKLGPVETLQEGGQPPVIEQPMLRMAADAAMPVPIAQGELAFQVSVSVTWSLLP